MKNVLIIIILFALNNISGSFNQPLFQIARLKYSGGGDWYNDPSGEVNLLKYVSKVTGIKTKPEYTFVELSSEKLFSFPFVFMTGHGNISLTEAEVKNLRKYLLNGGFLFADDDYGMDASFRREMKKVFPDREMVEIPYSHPIFNCYFRFPDGMPKIHEHDNKPPQTFGYFNGNRLCVVYSYEANIGDGWVDPDIYNDPPEKREQALKMGTNLIIYALSN